MRILVVDMSDSHGGCKFGLMNPDTVLYDEDTNGKLTPWQPKPTATQKFLWDEVYQPAIRKTFDLANGDPLYVNHNGDECHGKKWLTELVSTRDADQIEIAVKNMEPWYAYSTLEAVDFEAGTGAHNFLESSSTILVVKQLAALHGKTAICNHSLIDYGGVPVDVAHHGPHPGSRDWLRGNVARFYLRDLMYQEILDEKKPPRLVWRAHYHCPVHELLETGGYLSEIYVTPSLCGIGEHGIQATRSASRVTWGFNVFEIVDGELVKCHKMHHSEDLRTRKIYAVECALN
jgi:hypothetical protein